jgi:hypothetical protein
MSAAGSDIAHPDVDREYGVGWNESRDPPLSIGQVWTDPDLAMSPGPHPEERFLDSGDRFPLPEHGLVIDEDATSLQSERFFREALPRLSLVEGHLVASVEEDPHVVGDAVASLRRSPGALVILDHLQTSRQPPSHLALPLPFTERSGQLPQEQAQEHGRHAETERDDAEGATAQHCGGSLDNGSISDHAKSWWWKHPGGLHLVS